ncbi:aspartate ammonia-lyase [Limnobacter humi]|uniref:Aspartate ammonia-lyase n=1 Tax=Limnobacter humi TaxID=1778671 RepID=A0ABT1WCG1_9BURK|nr:aspartate ammonia-lyase [Limnobacter humi]
MAKAGSDVRIEKDLLGEKKIPADAYWGVHTSRALDNYQITGFALSNAPELVNALAAVKWACARANADLDVLPSHLADAIVKACKEIRQGKLHDQFVVDVIQGGAGTSTNMNANEVIANRAIEILGGQKGDYKLLHPIEHVNASQSTNDVYPTAVKLGLITALASLLDAMEELRDAFGEKAFEFRKILKIGRTQLQDAVPMTLGQEFSTFSTMLTEDIARVKEATSLIQEINLGATAIGTGINTDPEYAARARHYLEEITQLGLITAENLVEATQDTGAFVQLSGVLKRVAVKLSKTCNDLRLLSSGPQAGLNEINLPPRAAGSSIMPGKVNPVIPEVVNQVAFEVIGNDITVTMASEAGQLQLNAFEPIIAWSLFKSIHHLTAACRTLTKNCVLGISANESLLRARVEESASLATSLNPYIGYDQASEIAKTALKTGRKVADLVLEKGLLSEQQLTEILRPEVLTQPRRIKL